VESEYDSAGRLGQQDVALGDGPDAAVDHIHPYFARRELGKRVGQGLGRTTLVGLDDDPEHRDLALLQSAAEVLQRRALGAPPILRLALQPLALLRNLPGLHRIGYDRKDVAGGGHPLEAENLYRNGRTRRLDGFAAFVVESANST
jgi:hypothetical protein